MAFSIFKRQASEVSKMDAVVSILSVLSENGKSKKLTVSVAAPAP
jgi:hypothetical protein